MSNVWTIAKELKIGLKSLEDVARLPYTISYVIRKLIQVSSFNELPKEKRPPDSIVWWGTAEEIDSWIERVFDYKKFTPNEIVIREDEVE